MVPIVDWLRISGMAKDCAAIGIQYVTEPSPSLSTNAYAFR